MSKTLVVYVGVAVATLFGHLMLNNQRKIDNLEVLAKAGYAKEKIQDDSIRELIAALQQANYKNETIRSEGYVSGVVDAVNKPNYYADIWHKGYDRGASVQEEVMKVGLNQESPNEDK